MKGKFAVHFLLAFFLFAGSAMAETENVGEYREEKEESFTDLLVLYAPNRVVDFADMFTLNLGFGPSLKLQGWLTRFCSLGAGVGATGKLVKAYNRQYGMGLEQGWSASFFMVSAEDSEMTVATRGVQKYFLYRTGVPSVDEEIYNLWEGPRDIWEHGGEVACLVEVDAGLHPFEVFDFFAGIVFLDPKGDDFTMTELND